MTVKEFLESFEVYFSGMFESKGEKFDEAMHYACFGGGKRVRPTAVFLGASAISDCFPEGAVMSLAAALELIHSYSLVHDDLPAMDNDDLRRGQPTVHKKFGEATAILVGDALLTSSSTVLINAARVFGDDFLSAASVVTRASENMVRGQVMDIAGMKTAEQFKTMYSLKTGALITAAFQAGAIVAGGDPEQISAVVEYASNVGLAFQLVDDILDGDKDKNSIVSVIGVDGARKLIAECTARARESARTLPNGEILVKFAEDLQARKK